MSGQDGLYTGMKGVSPESSDTDGRLAQSEWNDFIGAKFNNPLG